MSPLQLYSSDVCPFALRVRLTLVQKAIELPASPILTGPKRSGVDCGRRGH